MCPIRHDRIELLKRISPPTPDVAYPVDLFVRRPARVWNMPVERPFGKWSVLAVFNYIDVRHGREPQVQHHLGCRQGSAPRSEQRVHRL